jgi:hypothetical protein
MVTLVILATQEAEIRRIEVPWQPGQKFARLHLNQCLGMVGCAWCSSYAGNTDRKIAAQVDTGIK